MEYRVWDKISRKWIAKTYMDQFGNLYEPGSRFTGFEATMVIPNERYIVHKNTYYLDKNDKYIFEGDICNIALPDEVLTCIVVYVPSCCSYLLAHDNGDKVDVYEFYEGAKDLIEVVGNVIEDGNIVRNFYVNENAKCGNVDRVEVNSNASA